LQHLFFEQGERHVTLCTFGRRVRDRHSDRCSCLRVIFSDKRIEVTVFGFDAGAGLSEHQASRAAIVQAVKGRLEFTADGEQLDAGPGFWLHMEPGTPHSLTAREPTVMLLTLFDAG
jgi:quercetin dioxygenase-like cupin family protein